MNRIGPVLLAFAAAACGVSHSELETKTREAEAAKQQADKQVAQLQQQLAADEQQIWELKNSLGLAQSQAITDDQKAALEEAKRAVQEAQERGKLLGDLTSRFKQMSDAGRLKVTTRHGRIVLQLQNEVLFDKGDADIKPEGKKALGEVASRLRGIGRAVSRWPATPTVSRLRPRRRRSFRATGNSPRRGPSPS